MAKSKANGQLATILRFEPALGTDELNLAEFPLSAITHRLDPNQRTLTFEDEIFDDGNQQQVQRRLVISASEHCGLPTPLDSDVLLVLLYLTNVRNGLTQRSISFSRYELVKLLGWDPGGKSYRRLDAALNRWASVTLYYNQAWWDRTGKKWRSRTFHVLESLDLRGRLDRDEELLSSFTWNEVLFTSLQSNNIKRLNLAFYFRLHSAAAKQMYRFLDKRFYLTPQLEYELRRFACEHIGFSRDYDVAQLKRRLQPAIEELEASGFLESLPMHERYCKRGRGDWSIVLTKARSSAMPSIKNAANSAVVAKLIERGVTPSVAGELERSFSIEQIEEKITLHDWLVNNRDRRAAKNPAGFLTKAIRQNYPLPKDFPGLRGGAMEAKTQSGIDIQPKSRATVIKQSEPTPDPLAVEFEQHWARMSADQQSAFESQAVAQGDPFKVATYERLRASGGSLFTQVQQTLLVAHAVQTGLVKNPRETAGGPSEKVRGRRRPTSSCSSSAD